MGYTPVNKIGDTISGDLVVNGNFTVNGSVTAFSASNIYLSSSVITVEDNILTLNAFSPYLRYAGIEMYDSGSGTLSQLLWDGDGDYFFLTGSSVNGKIITGPDGQTNLTSGYIPKATAGYKLGNSLIYDNGTNVAIGTTSPAAKLDVVSSPTAIGTIIRVRDTVTIGTGSFAGIHFTSSPGTDYTIGKLTTAAGAGLLQIRDQSGNQFVTVDSGGNVGIGTTSPAYLLDVSGSSRFGYRTIDDHYFTGSVNLSSTLTVSGLTYNESIQVDQFDYFQLQPYVEAGSFPSNVLQRLGGTIPAFTTYTGSTAPFGKVLYNTGYYEAIGDYIPVQAGETLYGEIWALRETGATGTAGGFYCGIARYDKNKNQIDGNNGLIYFITNNAVTVPSNSTWTKYSGSTTLPLTHTPYGASVTSDGGPIRYIRPYIIVNNASGTIPTFWSGFKIRKVQLTRDSGNVVVNGNLGIGTTTPNKQLTFGQVNDDAIQIRRITVGSGGPSVGTGISWTWTSANTDNETWAAIRAIFPGNGDSHLTFANRPANGVTTERMRIQNDGNIGIGTTLPTTPLHVVGVISGSSVNATTFNATSFVDSGLQSYGLREYVINFSAQSTASFYPVAINNPPGTDSTWHNQFSVDMTSQGGGEAYNMHSMYGEVRGQGWSDQNQFYRVFHNFYQSAERSILGIWRGTQDFYGVIVYLRGGKNYYVRTTSRSVVGYNAVQTLGNAVFAIKNAAGADVSGTSANIAEMLNLINNPSGFYHNDNAYIGTNQVVHLGTTSAPNLSIGGTAANATLLQTPRNIGGVSFNGSADINLPGVNTAGNQNTSGNAATATTASYANNINAANSYSAASITTTGKLEAGGNVIAGGQFSGAGTGLTGTAANLTAGTATNATQLGGVSAASYVTLTGTQTLLNKTLSGSLITVSNGQTITEYAGYVATPSDYPTCTEKARIYTIGTINSNAVYNSYIEIEVYGSHRGYDTTSYFEYKRWILLVGDKVSSNLVSCAGTSHYVGLWNGTDATGFNNTTAAGTVLRLVVLPRCGAGQEFVVKVRYANVDFTQGTFTYTNLASNPSVPSIGNQTINISGNAATVTTNANLTGDVTSTGNATTIASNAVTSVKIADSNVTLAKIVNISTGTILGNNGAGAAAPLALTSAQVASMLSGQTMNIGGNAATATVLQTARNIGGVSFNGSADINLPGVNTAGNQNTSGTATTATTANALNTGNSYTVNALTATSEIGTRGTNVGVNLERGDATIATLRFDADNFRLYAGGTGGIGETVRFTETGNVGIGTTVVNARVESYYSSNAITFNYLATNLNNNSPIPVYGFDVTNGAGENRSIKAGIGYERHEPNGRGTIHFYNDSANDTQSLSGNRSSAGDIKMSIDNSGNVGIGSVTPSYKLHVMGNGYFSSTLQVNSNITLSGGGDVIINDSDGTGAFNSFMDSGIGYIRIDDGGSANGKLNINSGLVYIQGAGNNVGIGTTVPGQKLDVEGRIRTRGATGTGGFEIGAATTGAAKWRIEWDSASDSLDFNWVG